MRKISSLALLAALPLALPILRSEGAPVPHISADAPFVARDLGIGYVAVDGPWAFHPGDNAGWAAPDLDDSAWPRIETGRPWEGQGFHNLTGFAWYRRRIVLATAPGANPHWQLGLALPAVEDAAEVY